MDTLWHTINSKVRKNITITTSNTYVVITV